MGNNCWLADFGFTKNPYDTMALSSEEGDKLLVGRDEETDFLIQTLVSNSKIPLLYGENGVGKSSIANVVAYRLSKEYSQGKERYFFLEQKRIVATQLTDLKEFEKSIYYEIICLLLKEKDFLKERKIKKQQIRDINKWMNKIIFPDGGAAIGPISGSYGQTPNPSAENTIIRIAQDWLSKCFSEPYKGGIIFIIDNLENGGTATEVKKSLEKMRDNLFKIPGLLWILCGTPSSVEGIRASKVLQGRITSKLVHPVPESLVPKLVERRIEYYGKAETEPPVGQELFSAVYKIVNNQLRIALGLCEEFAIFLHGYPEHLSNIRRDEFRTWIDQMASELPEKEYEVSEEAWELFDKITKLGSDISSIHLQPLGLSSLDELDSLTGSLRRKLLLGKTETEDGFILNVTKEGWLVNYKRRNYSIGDENW